jgi:hypothetical protein
MSQQQAPFIETKFGWDVGEGGWNVGMDENILKFSFLFDRNVDGIVTTLPSSPINGQAYFLTTDNRLYFRVNNLWYSTSTPKWFEFKIRLSGDTYRFDGSTASIISSTNGLETRLDSVELTISNLGTAAFEDSSSFITPSQLDIAESNAASYTDSQVSLVRSDLASSGVSGGVSLVGGAQRTVMNIAALAALGAGVSSVTVLHRESIADLGGGQFAWVAGDQSSFVTADPLQGVWVAPSSDTTGASGAYKRVGSALDFRYFGAKDDGSDAAGTTAAIQATYDYLKHIGGGAVRDDKGGQFALSATIRISGDGISSIFAGKNVTRFLRSNGDYGDTFHITPDDPVTQRLSYFVFGNCSIECSVEMNSGAHLRLDSCRQGTVFGIHWWNGFKSLSFTGLQNVVIHDTIIDTGAFYPVLKVGSKFVEALPPLNPTAENGEVFFSDFNWTHVANPTIEIGLDLREADGIWFSNGHIMGATTDCRIAPATAETQNFGYRFSNVWFDGFCERNLYILSNSTSGFGLVTFGNCVFSGSTGLHAIEISGGAVDLAQVNFTGGFIGNCTGGYVNAAQGDHVVFNGVQMSGGNRGASHDKAAVILGAGVRKFSLTGCQIGTAVGSHVFESGIDVQGVNSELNISNNDFTNCTQEIKLVGHQGLATRLSNNSTSRAAYNTVTAAATIAIPGVCETVELSGGTTVEQINYGWDGRTILIRAVGGTQTLAHNTGAGSGKIYTNAGTPLSLAAGKCVRLTYSTSAGGWLQSA